MGIITTDKERNFVSLLSSRCPPAVTKLLQATKHQMIESGGIKATRLYTHTADVEATNRKQLGALRGELHKFPAHDSDPGLSSQLDNLCPVTASIQLKQGAQVALYYSKSLW